MNTEHDTSNDWADWPLCPKCGHRRQAVCDSCGYAADWIPLAEYLEAVEASPIGKFQDGEHEETEPRENTFRALLMCPQCEEAFTPTFYRDCHWCGHEFSSGREIENPLADQLTPRVLWTIFALTVIGVGSLWYFLAVAS